MAKPIPIGALRKAERRLRAEVRDYRSVVAIGIGQKRSHRRTTNKHYGRTPQVCLTVFVTTKRKRPPSGERIPRFIEVKWHGATHRVPTDVESVGRPRLMAVPTLSGRMSGTPGCIAHHIESGTRLVVSAGHVLDRFQGPARINGVPVGPIVYGATWFESSVFPGTIADAGVAQVRNDAAIHAMEMHPWDTMHESPLVRSGEVQAMLNEGNPVYTETFGARNRAVFRVLAVVEEPTTIVERLSPFAPVLYALTAEQGVTQRGDSGAPVVLVNTSRLVAFHIAGRGNPAQFAWAYGAASAINELEIRLGVDLALAPPYVS